MIVAEIGLNHVGNLKLLNKYIDKLTKTDVDGITLQILKKKDLQKLKLDYCHINFLEIDNFIQKVKKKKKKVGLAIGDENIISNLKFIKKVDFFKVLSKDINNKKLITNLIINTTSKVYISTGFSTKKEINKLLKKYQLFKKRIILIYTDFNKEMNLIKLTNIELMKNHHNIKVAYGNHSHDKKMIYFSKIFKPESIFFYIKDNLKNEKKIKFPDNFHALKINEISRYLKKIHNVSKI